VAELVAAVSLGVDRGFGKPMEHGLRQCLIALRLAGRVGLDEEARAVVYYTALLVNVGCHTDAYEQAKWFGDDIALKSTKYDYEYRSIRGAASGLRMIGSGAPALHRFRVGLEFALSGHRDMDNMVEHHAAMARALGEELELPAEVLTALGAAYEQWDGRGWPGELRGEAVGGRQGRVAPVVAGHQAPVAQARGLRHRDVVLADRVDHHRAHVQYPATRIRERDHQVFRVHVVVVLRVRGSGADDPRHLIRRTLR